MTLAFFSTPPPVVKGRTPVLTAEQPAAPLSSGEDFLTAMEQASRHGGTHGGEVSPAPAADAAQADSTAGAEALLAMSMAAAMFKPMKDAEAKQHSLVVAQKSNAPVTKSNSGKSSPPASSSSAKPILNRGSNSGQTPIVSSKSAKNGSNTGQMLAANARKPVLAETPAESEPSTGENSSKTATKTIKRTSTATTTAPAPVIAAPVHVIPSVPTEITPIVSAKGDSHSDTENLRNDSSPAQTPKPAEVDPSTAPALIAAAPPKPIIFDDRGLTVSPEQKAWMDRTSAERNVPPTSRSVTGSAASEPVGPVEDKSVNTETVDKTAELRATVTAAADKEPPVPPVDAAAPPQLPIAAAPEIPPTVAFMAQIPVDGTAGALSSQRMKSKADKNEIAGPTAQKMPTTTAKAVLSSKPADGLAGQSNSGSVGTKADALPTPVVTQWSGKQSEWNVELNKAPITASAPAAADPSAQAERIGQMINQHVAMVRQSGTNNLAISLKLDPHTELNLQLTSHNGQIEASVQWERGSVAGLENHWKDLQDSLARQNVQLLPLDNGSTVVRSQSFNSSTDQGSSSSLYNQLSQQSQQRQNRGPQPELPEAVQVKNVPVTNKTTVRTASRQGWESWA
jgi:hypothetical protein